jgi:hypothetical protein
VKPRRYLVKLTFLVEVEAPNARFAIWSAKYRVRNMGEGTVADAVAIQEG